MITDAAGGSTETEPAIGGGGVVPPPDGGGVVVFPPPQPMAKIVSEVRTKRGPDTNSSSLLSKGEGGLEM